MTFKVYLLNLVNGVPHEVYIILLIVFCIGTAVLIAVKGWSKGLRYSLGLLLTEYVFLLYASTVIFRKAAKVREYDFTPFWSYSKPELFEENIMNVVVFVPVGILLGTQMAQITRIISQITQKAQKTQNDFRTLIARISLIAGLGLIISASIETLQFILMRGFSELDDVMHNTIGCIIGYGVYRLIRSICFKFKG